VEIESQDKSGGMSGAVNEEDGLAEMGIPVKDDSTTSPKGKVQTPFMVTDDDDPELENGVDQDDGVVHSSRKRRTSGLQALLADDAVHTSAVNPDESIRVSLFTTLH